MNRLTNIKLNQDGPTDPSAIQIGYDDLSRRTSISYANSCSATLTWAINNDLSSTWHQFVGSDVTFSYGYNKVHQATSNGVDDMAYMWLPTSESSIA